MSMSDLSPPRTFSIRDSVCCNFRRFPAVPLPRSATGDHPVLCQPDGSHLEECEKDEEDENENFLHLGDYGEYKGKLIPMLDIPC